MTREPPFETGAVHVNVTAESDAVATGVPAAPGVVYGVADVTAEAAPSPLVFAAETRNAYPTPFVSPVRIVVSPTTDDAASVQVTPPSIDFSIW